jgi:ferredoxin
MSDSKFMADRRWFLPRPSLRDLVGLLCGQGYTVIAPTRRDGVITMLPITDAADIAHSAVDEQDGGHYRLHDDPEGKNFRYAVGPDGPKRYFFPPRQKLFTMHVQGERFEMDTVGPEPPKYAFIGVRPCDLAAIAIQDRVFGIASDQDTFRCETETYYQQTRAQSLLIAVNCIRPGGTCFCASQETGPEVGEHHQYDLAMTELRGGFVIRVGSDKGRDLLSKLPVREPAEAELELEELRMIRAREHMGRTLDPKQAREALAKAVEHPRWDQVAERCLACANCTMVCPTCFCSTVTDSSDLASDKVTRHRQWESCHTLQFSYVTSGPSRNNTRSRYRQWLRHKLSTWYEQFGASGCVGCGRCITWCPVGIDLTEEASIIARDRTLTTTHLSESEVGS